MSLRRLLRLLALLGVAFVANLIVAWACILMAQFDDLVDIGLLVRGDLTHSPPKWTDFVVRQLRQETGADLDAPERALSQSAFGVVRTMSATLGTGDALRSQQYRVQIRAGWPLPAVAFQGHASRVQDLSSTGKWSRGRFANKPFLWRPVGPGIVGNVLGYTLCLGLLLMPGRLVARVRCSHRRRNGRCSVCGYRCVSGSVCPECGHPVPH